MRSINILYRNIGTSRKRPSKVNKIPSKRLKQPKNVFLRLLKGQSRMDNPQKLATLGTQDTKRRRSQQTTQYVGYCYAKTNTNNVNKT